MKYLLLIMILFLNSNAFACKEVSNVCVEGAATRTVNGKQVYRDCWKYETDYECYGEDYKDHCEVLPKSCSQVNTSCVKEEQGKCLEYKRTYECNEKTSSSEVQLVGTTHEIVNDYLDDSGCVTKGCIESESVCTEGSATRNIGGKEVYKDCWAYQKKYSCFSFSKQSDCAQYKGKCKLEGSTCVSTDAEGNCIHSEKRYSCLNPVSGAAQCRAMRYCIGDKCETITNTTNNDMNRAIAGLSMLNGIGKDFSKQQCNGTNCDIFKGTNRYCKINPVGSRNCCKDNGWAVDARLAQCSESEKMLAAQKQKNVCHFVGSYCAKKIAGFCVEKKQSYCCFGSKLAKVIQVQGRKQLGIAWGDAKSPNCQSLSLEQIQGLDFGKIDLSELYGDIKAKTTPDSEVLKKSQDSIKEKVEKYYAK